MWNRCHRATEEVSRVTTAADLMTSDREIDADDRWFAALIALRSQLAPEAREAFDREHAEAIEARTRRL